jgi:hypothetical protein
LFERKARLLFYSMPNSNPLLRVHKPTIYLSFHWNRTMYRHLSQSARRDCLNFHVSWNKTKTCSNNRISAITAIDWGLREPAPPNQQALSPLIRADPGTPCIVHQYTPSLNMTGELFWVPCTS